MSFFAIGVGGLAGYSSYMSGQAVNASAIQSQKNTRRRYKLKGDIAKSQMEEQRELAFEKMTEVTRSFMKTKGTLEAVQAETMVGGNVQKRLSHAANREASEEKGQIAKVADVNIINIAQSMIADKVDSEAMLMEAESKKKGSMELLLGAGLAAGTTFVDMGGVSSFNSFTSKSGIKET